MAPNSSPTFTNITSSGSYQNLIYLTGTRTVEETLTLSGSAPAYHGNFVIGEDAKVVAEPGMVYKATVANYAMIDPPGEGIFVLGTLIAEGSLAKPVIFTSLRDDSEKAGGPCGSFAATASAGDWAGIRFQGDGASGSSLKYAEIRFSGRPVSFAGGGVGSTWHSAALLIGGETCSPTIKHVTITDANNGTTDTIVYSAKNGVLTMVDNFGNEACVEYKVANGILTIEFDDYTMEFEKVK